jgi:uncharacterized protein YggU (UPF0235/DUF167 family)
VTAKLPLAETADGIIVTIKLTPKARSSGIDGVAEDLGPEGPRIVLRLRVTEPPESGKANAAMIALLAKSWRLPKSAFTVLAGATSRLKRVHIGGDAQALLRTITPHLQGGS